MLNILYQFNEKYAPYAGVSITSLLENNKDADGITFWILGEDLSSNSIKRLKETVEEYAVETIRRIEFVDTLELIGEMKALNMPTYRGSFAANIRLFVSRFIPPSVEKLLYLDADTVIVGSLSALFDFDIGDNAIGCVMDSVGEAHKADLGLDPSEGYYNSGVILFNMKVWRDCDYTGRIIDHVKNVRAQYPSPDQDLLNVVVRSGIKTLPMVYNFQPFHAAYNYKQYNCCYGKTHYYSEGEINAASASVVIYHCFRFIGEFPWDKGNYHPFNDIFDEYLKLSKWSDYVKTTNKRGLVTHVERLMYKILPKSVFIRIFFVAHGNFYAKANKESVAGKIDKRM